MRAMRFQRLMTGEAKSAPPVINHKEKKTMSNAITITTDANLPEAQATIKTVGSAGCRLGTDLLLST
jgi:hypothetical protein